MYNSSQLKSGSLSIQIPLYHECWYPERPQEGIVIREPNCTVSSISYILILFHIMYIHMALLYHNLHRENGRSKFPVFSCNSGEICFTLRSSFDEKEKTMKVTSYRPAVPRPIKYCLRELQDLNHKLACTGLP